MSDATPTQDPTPTVGTPTDAPETGAKPDQQNQAPPEPTDTDGLKKALKAERDARREAERRAKELEPFADQVRQAEESRKSAEQKAREAAETAAKRAETAERELLRYQVAAEKGVPAQLVRFLSGASKEEVTEAADLLLKELGPKPDPWARPTERLVSGKPSDDNDITDPLALIDALRGESSK